MSLAMAETTLPEVPQAERTLLITSALPACPAISRREHVRSMPLSYEQRTKYDQQRNAEETRKGNNIAPIPRTLVDSRREPCRFDLRLFCETYFPAAFRLAWSRDHLRVIAKIESAAKWRKLRPVIAPFFDVEAGTWRHGRIDLELATATAIL